MLNNLKEGGVSLIGHEQPLTQDHFRKSFIRRNKNPVINEKALTLRAMQSTLKVRKRGSLSTLFDSVQHMARVTFPLSNKGLNIDSGELNLAEYVCLQLGGLVSTCVLRLVIKS